MRAILLVLLLAAPVAAYTPPTTPCEYRVVSLKDRVVGGATVQKGVSGVVKWGVMEGGRFAFLIVWDAALVPRYVYTGTGARVAYYYPTPGVSEDRVPAADVGSPSMTCEYEYAGH